METVELLVETLQLLSLEDFAEFRTLADAEPSLVTCSSLEAANVQDVVDLMVKSSSGECVEAVRTVLMKMDRLDLVQRLSAADSGAKEKLSVDEEPSLLDQRILKLSSDIKLLLETLEHLRDQELKDFKKILRRVYLMHLPRKQHRMQEVADLQETADLEDTVIFIVQTNGEKSLVVTRDVLKNVGREDLAQRLLNSSFPSREMLLGKQSNWIHKVATMAAVKDVLLETLEDLNEPEFMELKLLLQFTKFQRNLPQIRWDKLNSADRTVMVDVLTNKYGKQSVEMIREVLLDLNRTDLALKLPETSSASKEKLPMKLNSALLQKVEKLEFVTELLLETLDELDEEELRMFLITTQITFHHHSRYMPFWVTRFPNVRYVVAGLVLSYFHQSVEKTMNVLKQMKKDDLVEKLSGRSSGPKGQHRSALSHKVATMAVVRQQLLETLDKLTHEEFVKFLRSSPKFSTRLKFITERAEVIDEMMNEFGQQSVEMIKDLLIEINRQDLAEDLQETGESFVDEADLLLKQKSTTADVRWDLFMILRKLNRRTLEKFKSRLQFTCFDRGLQQIPDFHLEEATAQSLVDLMVKEFGQQSVEIAREVLTDMTDVDQSPLEVTSEGREEREIKIPEKSHGEGIPMDFQVKLAETVIYLKDSSCCTKVEPEMKTEDPDEAPAYSLQSEAGLFECSVSGLRWFCSERVVFRYRFCSWDGHMERMESRGYRPAGPLLDISLITGRMTEVFLPHWICVDDVRKPLEQFAVLHMDDCGDAVEKVSEVSPSHVKLTEPVFSPRAVLMRAGFPVKVYCNMLLYRTNTAFLTLHVYLIPCDPALQQEMDQREKSYGYKVIRKPDPDMPLKMLDDFVLTADLESAEVCPERLKLRYNPTRPNFFEVYIKDPDTDFQMKLLQAKQLNPVWNCALRKDEYQKTQERQVKHYVEEHPSPQTQKAASLRSDREKLLEVIGDLKQQELKRFRFFLKKVEVFGCRADGGAAPPSITAGQLENADAVDLVDLMLQTFNQQAVEKTKEILRKIPRNDLLEALSGSSS